MRPLFPFVAAAVALAMGCSREPDAQAFGSAFPEPARNLSYVKGGRCNLDIASGAPTNRGWRTDASKTIWMSGWAYDDPSRRASDWVVVELAAPGDRARFFALSTIRKPHPQVIAQIGDVPASQNAAFELVARADTLPVGRYAIRVLMKGVGGGLICDTGRTLELG